METLSDGVITLDRWRPGDLDDLVATVSGSLEHIGAWLIWASSGYGPEEGTEFLTGTAERWASGEGFEYGIFDTDGTLAGGCGLMRRDEGREIGYWLAEPFTGRGLATRATALLLTEAWRLGAPHVDILHDELNTKSGAIPARLGFTLHRKEAASDAIAPACSGNDFVWRLLRPEAAGD
ncbi:GNAT family N-acetyltransferase [Amycolatopsis rhabdoformis]|uniref:GNAT family N-acetyltransferase n=1 Tax=Amycolatopsis rhabdoformis TaxID=1448059 RepID=A0ABZ1ICR0_9PSEU|nr:GNAT family N-acetyltransferase [Amycolatopsis rhabdoformis]WSE31210.1 GNAT family N-acetyltransferase [Amycolatopsis rhabdoformis]